MRLTLELPPSGGIPPQRPGWCTDKSYGNHIFFNQPGRGEPADLVILKWTTFPVNPPDGLNRPGIPFTLDD